MLRQAIISVNKNDSHSNFEFRPKFFVPQPWVTPPIFDKILKMIQNENINCFERYHTQN